MCTRRNFVVGGAALILGNCCSRRLVAEEIGGCTLSSEAAGAYVSWEEKISSRIARTGNRDFDFATAQMLGKLSDLFGVLPGFAYYTGERNAFASISTALGRPDGSVLFGRELLFDIMNLPEGAEASFSGVCAHEFGHIVQYKYNLHAILLDQQTTTCRLELHADFLAGYFSGYRKLQKDDFHSGSITAFIESLGNNNFTSPQFHGTREQRADAVVRGFTTAYNQRTFSDAVQVGLDYALNL